jgi:hypothetical protein
VGVDIKMELQEIHCDDVKWAEIGQDLPVDGFASRGYMIR